MSDPTLTTARIAMACYAAAILLWVWPRRGSRSKRLGTTLYVIGAIVFALHVVAAFHFRHHWSHAAAADNIRITTARTAGVYSAALAQTGIWLNYLFGVVWLGDAARRLRRGIRRSPRSLATVAVQAFMLFMVFNATVIFPSGPTRRIGIVLSLAVVGCAAASVLRTTSSFGRYSGRGGP